MVCENLITACKCPLPNFSFLLHLGHVKTQPKYVVLVWGMLRLEPIGI